MFTDRFLGALREQPQARGGKVKRALTAQGGECETAAGGGRGGEACRRIVGRREGNKDRRATALDAPDKRLPQKDGVKGSKTMLLLLQRR